ncbi:MAG: phosphoribosylamine--glycine ligase [Anaerolineae bacterium]
MNILIMGSGGREHALAWKVAQSARCERLYVAPGNAGTALLAKNVNLPQDGTAIARFALDKQIDLVLIGPEGPLAAGLADELQAEGIRVFGPSRAAAAIEASKSFSKAFMERHHIPTARYATFTHFELALRHLLQVDYPIVIKASGLAAGKGVILPDCADDAEKALRSIMIDREFGAAGDEVVIEERLEGEEVSVLAFTDGVTVKPLPPAQDHKRLLDGDEGLNTGGMGAYAPAPACPPDLVQEIVATVLQPAVDGLRTEAKPFVGVLYAGMMLTAQGPRVLEFNCRLGDPETQALLPLLESDLLDIALACTEGRLADVDIRWRSGAAACVVLAAPGYPDQYPSGLEINGLDLSVATDRVDEGIVVFHAGTRQDQGRIFTAGGRVLGVTGWGADLTHALDRAYTAINHIQFEGMQYRRDIGEKGLKRIAPRSGPARPVDNPFVAYSSAGVDIDAGNRAVALMTDAVRSTYGPEVIAGIGAFGGMFDVSALKGMEHPVLVASTDGVGTKVRLAAQVGRYESIGRDIVNHCIDDILVQGARPLFFLDYCASSKLVPEQVSALVRGMAGACREAGCALLGGETAEMPGVYATGEFDVVGTIVGLVERNRRLPRELHAGDILIGLRSSGPHTNGYSLIRKVFADVPLDTVLPALGAPLADYLLAPHRSYLSFLSSAKGPVHPGISALVHITGGGMIENVPRVLPDHLDAVIRPGRWPASPLWPLIQTRGDVSRDEMYRVFNMGIGMIVMVPPEEVDTIQAAIPEETWVIGELVPGARKVILA